MQTQNLNGLGTEYDIVDKTGNSIRAIKIIASSDILGSAIGEYNDDFYEGFDEYIQESKKYFSGFITDMTKVYWHTTTEENFQILEIVDICLEQQYDYAIYEIID